MTTSNQITPGMTIFLGGKLYRVESSVKVTVAKGTPFIKTKLKNLINEQVIEKNFKLKQAIEVVSLIEKSLEFLYVEGKKYLFIDIGSLDTILVDSEVIGERADYLKEGVEVNGAFYGETIFSIELPQFLELMVVNTEDEEKDLPVADATKIAVLETGAKVVVPPFIEVGDIVKVDTKSNEYIQRV